MGARGAGAREGRTDGHGQTQTNTDARQRAVGHAGTGRRLGGPCPSVSSVPSSATLAANASLSLLNLACYLLDRQLASLAAAFENEGGFTERLYRIRSQRRGTPPKP